MSDKPNPPLCDLWMNLCMADDGASLEIVPEDEPEVTRLLSLGLIQRKGNWVQMTPKGEQVREQISA